MLGSVHTATTGLVSSSTVRPFLSMTSAPSALVATRRVELTRASVKHDEDDDDDDDDDDE